jgi:hypothetical protein
MEGEGVISLLLIYNCNLLRHQPVQLVHQLIDCRIRRLNLSLEQRLIVIE